MYKVYLLKFNGETIYVGTSHTPSIFLHKKAVRRVMSAPNLKHQSVHIWLAEQLRKSTSPPTLELVVVKENISSEHDALILKRKAIYNLIRKKQLTIQNCCMWSRLCLSPAPDTILTKYVNAPKTYNFNKLIDHFEWKSTSELPVEKPFNYFERTMPERI